MGQKKPVADDSSAKGEKDGGNDYRNLTIGSMAFLPQFGPQNASVGVWVTGSSGSGAHSQPQHAGVLRAQAGAGVDLCARRDGNDDSRPA